MKLLQNVRHHVFRNTVMNITSPVLNTVPLVYACSPFYVQMFDTMILQI